MTTQERREEMTKLILEKSGLLVLEDHFNGEVSQTILPSRVIHSVDIKNINPVGQIEVALIIKVDEIDAKYSNHISKVQGMN